MSSASPSRDLPGALVLSLDFELHWGVRDHQPAEGPYRANLLGARAVIPRLLDMFQEFEMKDIGVEEAREMYGLILVGGWMSFVGHRAFWKKP